MNNFVRNFLTEWRRLEMPMSAEKIVAAVSGGADSVSLLLALHELRKLNKLNLRFVIAHFNHDLRGAESEKDLEFVRSLTTQYNFEFVFKIQNSNSKLQTQAGNLEQNARKERYSFLRETAENLNAHTILTAHTLNDQAETLLLNLIRGSGLNGLGGIKPSSKSVDQSKIALVRPLLNWAKRTDTENFCHLHKIEFRNDSMNEDLSFNRVRIRKILLPLLEDFNPKIIETLANTASLLREDAEFLEIAAQEVGERQLAKDSFSNNKDQKINDDEEADLQLKDLKNLFPSMRRQILREWLKAKRGDLRTLEAKHFAAIERLIFSRKSGKTVELPNGQKVKKEKGSLKFEQ